MSNATIRFNKTKIILQEKETITLTFKLTFYYLLIKKKKEKKGNPTNNTFNLIDKLNSSRFSTQ